MRFPLSLTIPSSCVIKSKMTLVEKKCEPFWKEERKGYNIYQCSLTTSRCIFLDVISCHLVPQIFGCTATTFVRGMKQFHILSVCSNLVLDLASFPWRRLWRYNRKFGNKMATNNVKKYASGRGERNIVINWRESPFKINIYQNDQKQFFGPPIPLSPLKS